MSEPRSVDPLFAQWLQREADYVVAASATHRWGTTERTTERVTAIATRAAALAQANRELDFWARAPFAIEAHQLVGTDWPAELGHVVTLSINQLGYDAGIDVYVYDVEVDRASGTSTVTVLRPLGSAS